MLQSVYPDDSTVDVFTSGRKMRLTVSPNIDVTEMRVGQTLRLNEALTVVEGCDFDVSGIVADYKRKRDLLAAGLKGAFEFELPGGAFYLFPYVAELLAPCVLKTSAEFAEALLTEARVALTAGEGFDAPGFVRISYATSRDRLREGVSRIQAFVHARQRGAATPAR